MTQSPKLNPPFRADHVGSLLRPAKLRQAFRDFSAGEISAETFAAIQDEAVRGAVAMQEETGLKSITDGEFRRASYWSHFVAGIDGLEVAEARFDFKDQSGAAMHFLAPHVTGRIRRRGPLSASEFEFLKSATSETPKVTLPSPPTMHFWDRTGSVSDAGYGGPEKFFADLAQIFQAEIADLAAAGAGYIQLDEVPLVMLCDEALRDRIRAAGEDPDLYVDHYIKLFNACLAGRPAEMTVALHICRGNFKGHWLTEGSYGYVAERVFREIDVDAFFLEYDSPRAGDFTPLAAVPLGKSVILGLVSSKLPQLENADDLKRRIDEAAAYLPLENLGLSPQCGFASAVSGNPVAEDEQKAKLALVVEVAEAVWGQR
ncbi:MAG: 5-methyltetrahydropteroyltriglutamate--homocysteine S-methyltransferase [Rhodospirillales bacterium]|jgi:5-methyltetrahydropteroyltriglutamate--homocysteine methyltransferase|nr:5-methyltetrahydropteroyltriglutamate--homocysteine S-methyltransferase [Rhodospirillales bacterium]MDP6642516.1 5-methyltetrahydropteroyltriglutamate--homocysteine S-methyltransferase [Rhodospirillales bacterium]MDP6842275.1 5-methyltetrahydropteroyltriglutamate--homocysteine S-methyltransferase [Rhodospirillales bacterium]|tara:strand:- start:760 stop:1878 length:1119 start_codon:yes stop_codon:yes gene_type:complete